MTKKETKNLKPAVVSVPVYFYLSDDGLEVLDREEMFAVFEEKLAQIERTGEFWEKGGCDNTDHKEGERKLYPVRMKPEFEGGVFHWCEDCIERDGDMIAEEQVCYECGDSVKAGSGKFVNRIPSFSNYVERIDMGVAHPEGSFLCEECDLKADD